jgi:hypothetical protein
LSKKKILNQTTGDNSFKRYKSEQDRFLGGFLLSAFEVIALGIGYNYQNIPATNTISDSIKTIWSDSTYKKWNILEPKDYDMDNFLVIF